MTSKQTKRALLGSLTSLLLCFAMLIGSTFAWFTDTASTKVNTIKSGNLDIGVYYAYPSDVVNGDVPEDKWKAVSEDKSLFNNDALWEPGYTEIVFLKFVNEGDLALKYQLKVDIIDEVLGKNKSGSEFRLSEYIQAYAVNFFTAADGYFFADRDSALNPVGAPSTGWHTTLKEAASLGVAQANGENALSLDSEYILSSKGNVTYATLVLWMPDTVGNEANHNGVDIPSIKLGVNVLAKQYTYESDSFDNTYDANAAYPDATSTAGLPTSGAAAEQYKKDLDSSNSIFTDSITGAYAPAAGSYTAADTLLTFDTTYSTVYLKDMNVTCKTLVTLTAENTVVLDSCNITLPTDGKLIVNNGGRDSQAIFYNVTVNGTAVTSANVSQYCTGIDNISVY